MQASPLDLFKVQHREIERLLESCEALADSNAVLTMLRRSSAMVISHLEAKDAFYVQLAALCTSKGDLPSGNIVKIFEQNMGVQSQAVRKFFSSLDAPAPNFGQSFKTMAFILRQRISTEEKAVFPMYAKHSK